MWVRKLDDTNVDPTDPKMKVLSDGSIWGLIEWRPGEPRTGIWDMGHLPGAKYSALREKYLTHEITLEEFLQEYQDPNNYRVEDWLRNRAHVDE